MKLLELFSEAELAAQIEAKMVRAVPHPSGLLTLYSYAIPRPSPPTCPPRRPC